MIRISTLMCLFFFCFLLLGCKKTIIQPNDLVGYWSIINASRDDVPTQLLESGYFIFSENKMISNILTSTDSLNYTLAEDKISIQDQNPIIFELTKFQNDTLSMTGLLNNLKFDLELKK
jgi:hypothetical protein